MATLKVQNIPPYINEDEFKRLFGQLEGCETCNLVAVPHNDSVGYAQFSTQQSAASARSMYNNWQGWGVKGLFLEAVPVNQAHQTAIKREREGSEPGTDAGAVFKQPHVMGDSNSVPGYSPTHPGAGMPTGPFSTQTSLPLGSQAQQRPADISYNGGLAANLSGLQQSLQQQGFSAATSQPSGTYVTSSQPFSTSQAQGGFAPNQQQYAATPAPQGFNQGGGGYGQNQVGSGQGQRQPGFQGAPLQNQIPGQLSGDPAAQQADPRAAAQPQGQRQAGFQASSQLLGTNPPQQAAAPMGGPVQQQFGGQGYGQPPAQLQPQLAQQNLGQQYNPQGQGPQLSLAPQFQAPQYAQMNQLPQQTGQPGLGPAPGMLEQPGNPGFAPQPYGVPQQPQMQQQLPQQLLGQLAGNNLANLLPNLGMNLGALGSLGLSAGQGMPPEAIAQLLQIGGVDQNAIQQRNPAILPPARPAGPEPLPLPADAIQTLYVDGMPLDVTKREMCHIFRPFEGFKEVRLVNKTDKTGQAMILCFAEFEAVHHAAAALNTLQGYAFDMATPEEHRLRISFAKPTKPTDPRSRMGNGPSRPSAYNPADLPPGRDNRSGSRWDSGGGGNRNDGRGDRRNRDRDGDRGDRRGGHPGQDRRDDNKRRRY